MPAVTPAEVTMNQYDVVVRSRIMQRQVGYQLLAVRCADRRGHSADGDQAVVPLRRQEGVCFGEYIHRTGDVERLHAGEKEQGHGFQDALPIAGAGTDGK